MHKGYMPLCKPEHLYPETQALQDLRRFAGDRTALVMGEETMIPCTNADAAITSTITAICHAPNASSVMPPTPRT